MKCFVWVSHDMNKQYAKHQELVLKGICISQSETKPNINAKCPNLKHKAQLVMYKTTSTKVRFKIKPNDQNRSQSFAYCKFKQSTKCPQKDQHPFMKQIAQMINVKQRHANVHKMDIQIRKSKSKQKSMQRLWNFYASYSCYEQTSCKKLIPEELIW